VTLRQHLLRHLGVAPGDRIELITLPGGRVELRAVRPSGSIDGVIAHEGRQHCSRTRGSRQSFCVEPLLSYRQHLLLELPQQGVSPVGDALQGLFNPLFVGHQGIASGHLASQRQDAPSCFR